MSTRQDERDGDRHADHAGPTPTNEPAPISEPAPVNEPAPTDEPAPPDEPALTDEPAPLDGPAPTDEAGPPSGDAGDAVGEDDRWTRFAPQPERPPTRLRRLAAGVGRLLVHEWTLASLGALALAVVMTWPTLRDPARTLPHDIWDPSLQAWQVAWAGHILTTDPTQLWHGNVFWPERYSYAFSDSLLGYAPLGMIGEGPAAALVRYNILYVLAFALATLGAYALVRQLGAGRTGAAVAGVAFAYAPWRLAQAGHLHVISSGGIALALAMLARGHGWSLRHGYRPERRHAGWALAGWLVAAWQLSLGFGIGLPFAYVLALITLVAPLVWAVRRRRAGRRPFGARLLLADLVGGLVFAATGLLMAQPYLKVVQLHPYAKRSPDEIALYSPPLRGFLTAPAESWLWGGRHAAARATLPWHPEMTLLPGFALYGLAVAGLLFSIWRLRVRLLLLAGVLVTIVLAMGTGFADDGRPGYMTFHGLLPGWDAIRTPGRRGLWTTLLLGVLAAGAVSAFVSRAAELTAERVPPRPGVWLRIATLVPLALVLVEGVNRTPHPQVPPAPAALRTAEAPLLVLPLQPHWDQPAMLWSTDGFPGIVNGTSGFTPASQRRLEEAVRSFPDVESVAYLRERGVRSVVLLPDQAAGTHWETAAHVPVEALDITREEVAGAIVYRLG